MTYCIEIYYKIEYTISLQQLESSCMKWDIMFYKIWCFLSDIFNRDKNLSAFEETNCVYLTFLGVNIFINSFFNDSVFLFVFDAIFIMKFIMGIYLFLLSF